MNNRNNNNYYYLLTLKENKLVQGFEYDTLSHRIPGEEWGVIGGSVERLKIRQAAAFWKSCRLPTWEPPARRQLSI